MISVGKAPSPGSSAVSEKVRTRLEELDDLEEVGFHFKSAGMVKCPEFKPTVKTIIILCVCVPRVPRESY